MNGPSIASKPMLLCLSLVALVLGPSRASLGMGNGAPPESPTASVAACAERAVDAVQRRYRSIRDMRARFTQSTRTVALGHRPSSPALESSGSVVFAKPGKMRWAYEKPDESLVVSDGQTLWLYDPVRREAQKLTVSGGGYMSGAAIQFLLGEGDIRGEFRIKAESCDGEDAWLELLPRRPASYEKLRIRADPRSGELLATTVVDLLGNVTDVTFSEIRSNLAPPAELFRFDPPPGVRVIDLDAIRGVGEATN
jgi:outer membrane lipoprotein-sorting protein